MESLFHCPELRREKFAGGLASSCTEQGTGEAPLEEEEEGREERADRVGGYFVAGTSEHSGPPS